MNIASMNYFLSDFLGIFSYLFINAGVVYISVLFFRRLGNI